MPIDNLVAANLVINPPAQESGLFGYKPIFEAANIDVAAPIFAGGIFGSLAAQPFSIQSPELGVGNFVRSPHQLVPASIALGQLNRRRCLGTPQLKQNLSAPRQIIALDRHIRRDGDAYAEAWSNLLPVGLAWPRHSGTVLMAIVRGLGQVWGNWADRRAADLLEQETDPRKTLELLTDWERNWGLPEECFAEATTIEQRRDQLVMKMTLLGGQSRDFFQFVASWVGNHILITEYAPFMCGISECGDTRDDQGDYRWEIGPPEMRFYWTVHIDNARLTWFRASAGQAGVDPHLRIGTAIDLECLLRRWKPAHTDIVFDYSGLQHGGPMAGTP